MQAIGFALLAVISWAAFTLLLRGTVEVWGVGLAGALSRILSVLVLLGWVLATGDGWRRLRTKGNVGLMLVMGLVAVAINLLWFGSLNWTTATNVALLFRLDLLFVVIIGAVLGLERVGWKQLLVLPVMLAGLALLTEVDRFEWAGHLIGDMMVVGAALGFAVNAFIIRRILRTMDEVAVSVYNKLASMTGFIVLALYNNDFPRAAEVARQPGAVAWLVALALVSALSLPLYYAALRRMAVWELRAFMLAAPVMVAAVEWFAWDLHLTVQQGLGAVMVLAGLAVLIRLELHNPAAASPQTLTESD